MKREDFNSWVQNEIGDLVCEAHGYEIFIWPRMTIIERSSLQLWGVEVWKDDEVVWSHGEMRSKELAVLASVDYCMKEEKIKEVLEAIAERLQEIELP